MVVECPYYFPEHWETSPGEATVAFFADSPPGRTTVKGFVEQVLKFLGWIFWREKIYEPDEFVPGSVESVLPIAPQWPEIVAGQVFFGSRLRARINIIPAQNYLGKFLKYVPKRDYFALVFQTASFFPEGDEKFFHSSFVVVAEGFDVQSQNNIAVSVVSTFRAPFSLPG